MKKMKQFNMRNIGKLAVGLAMAGLVSSAHALEPRVVTFDNGTEVWMPAGDCGTIMPDGGNPGAHWNVASVICETDEPVLQPFFVLSNISDPARWTSSWAAVSRIQVAVGPSSGSTSAWFSSL